MSDNSGHGHQAKRTGPLVEASGVDGLLLENFLESSLAQHHQSAHPFFHEAADPLQRRTRRNDPSSFHADHALSVGEMPAVCHPESLISAPTHDAVDLAPQGLIVGPGHSTAPVSIPAQTSFQPLATQPREHQHWATPSWQGQFPALDSSAGSLGSFGGVTWPSGQLGANVPSAPLRARAHTWYDEQSGRTGMSPIAHAPSWGLQTSTNPAPQLTSPTMLASAGPTDSPALNSDDGDSEHSHRFSNPPFLLSANLSQASASTSAINETTHPGFASEVRAPPGASPALSERTKTDLSPEGEAEASDERQRRTLLACAFCRLRKLRCDGEQPCRQCDRRGERCEYVLPPAAKKRALKKSQASSEVLAKPQPGRGRSASSVVSKGKAASAQAAGKQKSSSPPPKTLSSSAAGKGPRKRMSALEMPDDLPVVTDASPTSGLVRADPGNVSPNTSLADESSTHHLGASENSATHRDVRRHSETSMRGPRPRVPSAEQSSAPVPSTGSGNFVQLNAIQAGDTRASDFVIQFGNARFTPQAMPNRSPAQIAAHISDILGDVGALTDAVQMLSVSENYGEQGLDPSPKAVVDTQHARHSKAMYAGIQRAIKSQQDGWWDEMLEMISRSAPTPLHEHPSSRARSLLLQFCTANSSHVYFLHPPTLLRRTLHASGRESCHPALYFAAAAVGTLSQDASSREEEWRGEPATGMQQDRLLAQRLTAAAYAHLHSFDMCNAALGVQGAQAAATLALLESNDMERQRSVLRFFVGLISRLGLEQHLAATTRVEDHLPVPPSEPGFFSLPSVEHNASEESDIRRETAVRLVWAPTVIGMRNLSRIPDGDLVCTDTSRIGAGGAWLPSALHANPAAIPQSFYESRFLLRVGVVIMRIAQMIAVPDRNCPQLLFALRKGPQTRHAEALAALDCVEPLFAGVLGPFLADEKLMAGRKIVEGFCHLAAQIRCDARAALGIWHTQVYSGSQKQRTLPPSIEGWMQALSFRCKEIEEDVERMRLDKTSFEATGPEMDSWPRKLRVCGKVLEGSGYHPHVQERTWQYFNAIEEHIRLRPSHTPLPATAADWPAIRAEVLGILATGGGVAT